MTHNRPQNTSATSTLPYPCWLLGPTTSQHIRGRGFIWGIVTIFFRLSYMQFSRPVKLEIDVLCRKSDSNPWPLGYSLAYLKRFAGSLIEWGISVSLDLTHSPEYVSYDSNTAVLPFIDDSKESDQVVRSLQRLDITVQGSLFPQWCYTLPFWWKRHS